MIRLHRIVGISVAVAVGTAFLVFVWPTAYRPMAVNLSGWPRGTDGWADLRPIAARQNRFSGEVELLTVPVGWISVGPSATSESIPHASLDEDDPGAELHRLAIEYGVKPKNVWTNRWLIASAPGVFVLVLGAVIIVRRGLRRRPDAASHSPTPHATNAYEPARDRPSAIVRPLTEAEKEAVAKEVYRHLREMNLPLSQVELRQQPPTKPSTGSSSS